ncbi:hypothetical protein yfred0001_41330 [Yersinia frederiksenii ATCC 33641]|nr:hypothetical protein yfred0001_41330 [Yersinia frederiksenii ATCC 33641]
MPLRKLNKSSVCSYFYCLLSLKINYLFTSMSILSDEQIKFV